MSAVLAPERILQVHRTNHLYRQVRLLRTYQIVDGECIVEYDVNPMRSLEAAVAPSRSQRIRACCFSSHSYCMDVPFQPCRLLSKAFCYTLSTLPLLVSNDIHFSSRHDFTVPKPHPSFVWNLSLASAGLAKKLAHQCHQRTLVTAAAAKRFSWITAAQESRWRHTLSTLSLTVWECSTWRGHPLAMARGP